MGMIFYSRHIFTRLWLVKIFCVLVKYFPILYSDSCYKYYIYARITKIYARITKIYARITKIYARITKILPGLLKYMSGLLKYMPGLLKFLEVNEKFISFKLYHKYIDISYIM